MVSSRTLKHICPLDPLPLLNNSNVKKILRPNLFDYITCTFIILYIQECMNHGGSNSIQGGNRKFLGCTQ